MTQENAKVAAANGACWMKVERFEKATDEEIVKHVPLIRHMIKAHDYGAELTYEEMFAIGLVAVAVALERYDAERCDNLGAWIAYQIDKAIRNERRMVMTQRKRGAVVTTDDPDDDPLLDALACAPSHVDEIAEREERELMTRILRDALETLAEEERYIVRAIYYDRRSQVEIGKELGLSQSWISRIVKRALRQLRYAIEARRNDTEAQERGRRAEARKRYAEMTI